MVIRPQKARQAVNRQSEAARLASFDPINLSMCFKCGIRTPSVTRKEFGYVTVVWIVVLIFVVPMFFWLPLVVNKCKDTSMSCRECGDVKSKVRANCCK